MTFNSWEFLIFYPVVLLLYYVLPRFMRWPMLLVASYFFYMCYSPSLVFLILGTTLISWLSAKIIDATERASLRRAALVITLISSLGVLFFYKYFDFLSASFFAVLGGEPWLLHLALPVGISFYTFQTLSYVIDVYRGEVKTEKNFFFYALFVSFFPQLVAGPIERPANLIPQLKRENKWSRENAVAGAKFMLLGFFKKVCVADLVSSSVDAVYNNPDGATSLAVVGATVLFALQIYCDFSGYTDIAIGCARIMGIRLMKNFDHPYRATTIKEFWSRWHISLSSWFKDYLYFPLGGSRCAKWRHLLNLMIVFLVSGLWHGAAWTFVLWGALHGFYQIVGNLTASPRAALLKRLGIKSDARPIIYLRRTVTFVLVSFGWLIFRANSISDAFSLIGSLFSFGGVSEAFSQLNLDPVSLILIIVSFLVLLLMDNLITYEGDGDGSAAVVRGGSFIYFVWIIFIVWALLLSKNMISSFIYFQF
ncbi:MAG: MBOAT family protein [Clostridia bacterium]|nr:MBOAT family protein [Clostridia bacterium]